MFIFCWLNNNIVHLFLCKKIFSIIFYVFMLLFNLLILYELLAIIISLYYFIYQFFILLECSSKNCVLCSNLATSIISVRRLKLCHRNILIVPQRNERIKSDIKLSDCALFKRVLLFSSVRCLVLKAIKFICYPFWAP